MTEVAKLLLVSGGSLVGGNILDALEGRREAIEVHATNSAASGCGLERFDTVHLTPPTVKDPVEFERRLIEVIDRVLPDLVIPCRDDDVVFLADLRTRRPDLERCILCGTPEVAEATFDKASSGRFCAEHGLPFAPTLATPAVSSEAVTFAWIHGYPLLVKPVSGYASRDVRLVLNEGQLLRAASAPGMLIQRYLGDPEGVLDWRREIDDIGLPLFHTFEGLKYSIQIMIGPDGRCAGNFCSINVNRHGTSTQLERYSGEDARELGLCCATAFAKAGWRGPVNIQCHKAPEGALFIYEFNARFSGATAARRLMGYDEVGLAIALFTGVKIATVPVPGFSDRVSRIAVDRVESDRLQHDLLHDGFWQGSTE